MEKEKKRYGWSCDILVAGKNKYHDDIYRYYEFLGTLWSVACDIEEKRHGAKNIKIFTVQITDASEQDLEDIKKTTENIGDL